MRSIKVIKVTEKRAHAERHTLLDKNWPSINTLQFYKSTASTGRCCQHGYSFTQILQHLGNNLCRIILAYSLLHFTCALCYLDPLFAVIIWPKSTKISGIILNFAVHYSVANIKYGRIELKKKKEHKKIRIHQQYLINEAKEWTDDQKRKLFYEMRAQKNEWSKKAECDRETKSKFSLKNYTLNKCWSHLPQMLNTHTVYLNAYKRYIITCWSFNKGFQLVCYPYTQQEWKKTLTQLDYRNKYGVRRATTQPIITMNLLVNFFLSR